jgi:hypothetical protein
MRGEADSIVAVNFMGETFMARPRSMDSRHRTPSPAPIRAHSAALITEVPRAASPHVDSRASVEVSTEVAVVTVAAVTDDPFHFHKCNLEHGEQKSCALRI